MSQKVTIYRVQWMFDAPTTYDLRAVSKGAIAVGGDGTILARGSYAEVKKLYPRASVKDFGPSSIMTPGFVDAHVHAPQLEMMGAAGYGLLDWLNHHTFPTEKKYSNLKYAKKQWEHFCQELLENGTTTAAVYSTSHMDATWLLLEACHKSGLRAHVGPSLMDRNAPKELVVPATKALRELEEAITKWKKTERVNLAITVRFAPTSSAELLQGAGALAQKHPHLVVQTHLGETRDEVNWVKELFPKYTDYTSVYSEHGLVHEKTLLAHGIYLEDQEVQNISQHKAMVVHCPTSNFFLGSGLLSYVRLKHHNVPVGLGSDVGAGWDLCMSSVARGCYEAQALQGHFLRPGELLYLATRAGAMVLGGKDDLGLLEPGFKADFLIHDVGPKDLLHERFKRAENPDDILSALLFLGSDATIDSTYVDGKLCFKRSTARGSKRKL